MFTNLSKKFFNLSNKKFTILGFILFFFFSIIFLPDQNRITEVYSAGLGSPDTSFLYTPAKLYQMAGTYGTEGRAAYIHARWTFDIAFPIIYTFFLVTSISWFEKKVLKEDSEFRTGNMLPFFAMVFDLVENICTTLVFANYPSYLAWVNMLAPFFTLMKWICVASSFILLLALIILSLIKRKEKSIP